MCKCFFKIIVTELQGPSGEDGTVGERGEPGEQVTNYFFAYLTRHPQVNTVLNPRQTIATFKRNISQHCWANMLPCVWPPCCEVLRVVATCWVLLAQI